MHLVVVQLVLIVILLETMEPIILDLTHTTRVEVEVEVVLQEIKVLTIITLLAHLLILDLMELTNTDGVLMIL